MSLEHDRTVMVDGQAVPLADLMTAWRRQDQKRKDVEKYKWMWNIQISDSCCTWSYPLPNNSGKLSIREVYEAVRKMLDAPKRDGLLVRRFKL